MKVKLFKRSLKEGFSVIDDFGPIEDGLLTVWIAVGDLVTEDDECEVVVTIEEILLSAEKHDEIYSFDIEDHEEVTILGPNDKDKVVNTFDWWSNLIRSVQVDIVRNTISDSIRYANRVDWIRVIHDNQFKVEKHTPIQQTYIEEALKDIANEVKKAIEKRIEKGRPKTKAA